MSPIILLILQGVCVFMVIMTLNHILSLDELLKVALLSLLIPDNVNAVLYSCNDLKCNDPQQCTRETFILIVQNFVFCFVRIC